MQNNMPLVTCFILNWNRSEETIRAIESVRNQTYPNIEILIVDNNSVDNSVESIKELYKDINIIELDRNYGCPGGRNRGIQHCKGDFIFFCDNDGVLHKDAIKNAMLCIIKDEKIAIVTGLVKDFESVSEINLEYDLGKPHFIDTNLFQGGISLHKKFIYDLISCYPDDYIYGGEESFLSLRIIDNKYKIVKSNQVILWHKKSQIARNNEKETLRKWGNALMNAYQLYPIEFFLIYFLYFFTVYPIYAIKYNYFNSYLKSLRMFIKRFKNYNRIPVSRNSYKYFKSFNK